MKVDEQEDVSEEAASGEPWYDPTDGECDCTDEGDLPEWEWSSEEGCYVCQKCGTVY